jgi:hypothetical protein
VDASSAREERVRIPFSRHVLQLCALILVFICSPNLSLPFTLKKKTAVAKNVQNQENLGQKAKAKPPDPAMDSHEDREHHSLQRQETTLEKNQVEHLIHYYYI